MTVTWLSAFIPVWIGIIRFRPDLTARALAFFAPFSASAVINIEAIPFGVLPYHVLAGWLIFQEAFRVVSRGKLYCPRAIQRPMRWMLSFIVFLALLLLSRGTEVTATNLAQLAHVGFGIAAAWSLSAQIARHPHWLSSIVLSFIGGCVFAAAWGVMQYVLAHLGKDYPAWLFNNSVGASSGGFAATYETGALKVSSVATEASFLARCLVMALTMLLVRIAVGPVRPLRSRALLHSAVALLSLTILMTASTTGFLGVAAALSFLTLGRGITRRVLVSLVIVSLGAFLLVATAMTFPEVIYEATVGKVDTFSFLDRLESLRAGWGYFLAHPLFGSGLGTHTVHDLFIKLLADTGLLGLLLFIGIMVSLYSGLSGSLGHDWPPRATALSFAVLLVMDAAAGLSYTYPHFWLGIGLLLSTRVLVSPHRSAASHARIQAPAPAQ